MPQTLHIAIIGGGAAGFFAAIEAKRNFPNIFPILFYLFYFGNYRKYYKRSRKIPAVYGSCNSNFMCTAYNLAKNFWL